jgi:hypothetical protein
MRKLLLDKISIPILILGIFVVGALGWFLYHMTIGSFTTTIFYDRFDHEAIRHMDVSYQSGYIISGWDSSKSGLVIGTISDKKTRDRLLTMQPFTDCPYGCSGWYHDKDRKSRSHEDEYYSGLIGSRDIPRNYRTQFDAATTGDSHCVKRYVKRGVSNDAISSDVFCFSPKSGAFVYQFAEV